ncbi:metallophosphoesterase, partial [bacterium]|nr:metallophosphoesterase [bacterium]
MVRILAAGDFHGDKQIAVYLANKAVYEKADLIVLNGDIVEEDDTEGVMHHFVKTGKPVFLVPGNHD